MGKDLTNEQGDYEAPIGPRLASMANKDVQAALARVNAKLTVKEIMLRPDGGDILLSLWRKLLEPEMQPLADVIQKGRTHLL